jgi:hypothetical protein
MITEGLATVSRNKRTIHAEIGQFTGSKKPREIPICEMAYRATLTLRETNELIGSLEPIRAPKDRIIAKDWRLIKAEGSAYGCQIYDSREQELADLICDPYVRAVRIDGGSTIYLLRAKV